jgi:hypothetical protein
MKTKFKYLSILGLCLFPALANASDVICKENRAGQKPRTLSLSENRNDHKFSLVAEGSDKAKNELLASNLRCDAIPHDPFVRDCFSGTGTSTDTVVRFKKVTQIDGAESTIQGKLVESTSLAIEVVSPKYKEAATVSFDIGDCSIVEMQSGLGGMQKGGGGEY